MPLSSVAAFLLSFIFIGAHPLLVLKEVEIPQLFPQGSSPTLKCQLGLGRLAQLKHVKWYKDGQEFCSFVPYSDQLRTKEISQLHVKDVNCDNSSVILSGVTVKTSGIYRCEATEHQNVMSSRNMSVMVYPTSDPVITGLMPDYREGELIHANCTASPSNPPPKLTWYINGILADKFMIHEYTEAVDPGGLYKRALGLKMMAKDNMFSGPGGTVFLVCVVTLPGFPSWKAMASPKFVLPPTLLPIQVENTTDLVFNVTTMNNTGHLIDFPIFLGAILCGNFLEAANRLKILP